jgi:prolyl oligopeptidase
MSSTSNSAFVPGDYPAARRDETVREDHFGRIIADPYRWLEDPDAEETKASF